MPHISDGGVDTMGLVVHQKSGHIVPKPHYNAKQVSSRSYGCLEVVSHPRKPPSIVIIFLKLDSIKSHLEKQTWLSVTVSG